MKARFETMLKGHIESLISTETDDAYKAHLKLALNDVTALHGGYFSKDNASKDKQDADIERQTLEILHEKEAAGLCKPSPLHFFHVDATGRLGQSKCLHDM